MALKVVVIGGGSSYTPELVEGLIMRRESLPVEELVFVDVEAGEEKVQVNTDLVKRMFIKENMPTKISYTLNRRDALVDADFVMTQFRVGGLRARALDERIPLKYNMVGQETTGAGGFAKALRTIPVMMDICKDIEEICPEAWLINFTNPSGIVTEAINNHTNVKSIGLCNVPINMIYDAAEKLEVAQEALDCRFVGLNHLSFMTHAYHNGVDRLQEVLAVDNEEGLVQNIDKIDEADELARIYGLMPSPYMQYFYFETDMIKEEIEKRDNGDGTRAEEVMKVEESLFEKYRDPNLDVKPEELSMRGGSRYSEAAINLIDSIHNDKRDIQVVNVLNQGSISDLPYEAAVETNCVIGRNGATPIVNGPLPQEVAGLIKQVKSYEAYAIEAALSGDRNKAMLALMNNPLVHNAKDARCVLEELIEAHTPFLDYFNNDKTEAE